VNKAVARSPRFIHLNKALAGSPLAAGSADHRIPRGIPNRFAAGAGHRPYSL